MARPSCRARMEPGGSRKGHDGLSRLVGAGRAGSGLILLAAVAVLGMAAPSVAHVLELQRPPAPTVDPHREQAASAVARTDRGATPVAPGFRPQHAPCLLVDTGLRKPEHKRLAPGARPTQSLTNYDPGSGLPPNLLHRDRYEQLRRFLGAPNLEALEAEFRAAARRGAGEPPDTHRVLILRVEFENDTPGDRTTGDGRFDLRDLRDTSLVQFDPPPHDKRYFETHMRALKRYYESQLQGRIVIEFDVFPEENDAAYRLPDTFPYGPWIFSNSNPDVLQHAIDLVGDTLAEVDATDPDIDFTRYRHHMIFHAGSDFQGDVNRDTPWDIPSFNLFVVDPFVVQDSVAIDLVLVVPETVSQDDFAGALNGVVAHEFGHQLGFVDLYDVRVGAPVVGAFSLMDSGDNLFALIEDPPGSGINRAIRGTLPSSIDPFHKLYWFPEAVDFKDFGADLSGENTRVSYELETVQLGNDILYVPLNLSELLLFENRHLDLNGDSTVVIRQDPVTGVILGPGIDPADSSSVSDSLVALAEKEYDWLIPGEGVIGWHIDWLAILSGNSQPGGGVNIFFNRPGIGLIEADGIRDIGTASEEYLGGPYDPFFKGGYDLLAPETVPSTDTNDGTPTGITVAVLDTIGPTMRVGVTSELFPAGWPVRVLAAPNDEQVLVMDTATSGAPRVLFPAVDPGGLGNVLFEVPPAGGAVELFAFLPDSVDPGTGLAGREDFLGSGERGSAVALVSGGQLHLFDGRGFTTALWPPAPEASLAATSTPVLLDSLAIVGCSDGRIRAISAGGTLVAATFDTGAPGPIRRVGAGSPRPGGTTVVVWAAEDGFVGAFPYDDPGSGWSRQAAPGRTPVSLLAVPGADDRLDTFVVWADGGIDRFDPDGERVPGWPYLLDEEPAADLIVADVDRDGALEAIMATRNGRMHAIAANGVSLVGWPRSAWSVDETPYLDQLAGPRAFDLDLDGAPELFLHRGDGLLFAWDHEGDEIPGFPLSFGGPGLHGPQIIPGVRVPTSSPRLVVGTLEGFQSETGYSVSSLTTVRARTVIADGPGFFPVAGVDQARSRIYPAAWRPAPQPAEDALADLRLYPNPLRADALTVRFVVAAPTRLDLEAFDLDGESVARTSIDGQAGAAGNQVRWDLSALASGLYHVRVRAEALDFERFERIAIVR